MTDGTGTVMKAGGGKLWAGLFVLAAAVATGLWWQTTRSPDAPIAAIGDEPDTPFAVLRCDARSREAGPALAVTFSRPLARKLPLGELMTVTDLGDSESREAGGKVVGNWYLGDNPRIAYFSGVLPKRRYRIDVAVGVASRAGDQLVAGSARQLAVVRHRRHMEQHAILARIGMALCNQRLDDRDHAADMLRRMRTVRRLDNPQRAPVLAIDALKMRRDLRHDRTQNPRRGAQDRPASLVLHRPHLRRAAPV